MLQTQRFLFFNLFEDNMFLFQCLTIKWYTRRVIVNTFMLKYIQSSYKLFCKFEIPPKVKILPRRLQGLSYTTSKVIYSKALVSKPCTKNVHTYRIRFFK